MSLMHRVWAERDDPNMGPVSLGYRERCMQDGSPAHDVLTRHMHDEGPVTPSGWATVAVNETYDVDDALAKWLTDHQGLLPKEEIGRWFDVDPELLK